MRERYHCKNRNWFSWFYTVDFFLDLELSCRGKSKELSSGISLVVVAVTTGCEDWLRDKMIGKVKFATLILYYIILSLHRYIAI